MITTEKSWHTEGEWFVRQAGGYRGEVVYYPATMRWHARRWHVSGRRDARFFEEMDDAIRFVTAA